MSTKSSKFKSSRIFIIVILFIAIIIGISTFAVYKYEYNKYLEREAVSLSGYYKDVCNNLASKQDFYNELIRLLDEKYFTRMRMDMTSFINLTSDSLEIAKNNADLAKNDFYMLDTNLDVVFQQTENPISLSDDELNQLIQSGRYSSSQRCYISQQTDGGYYILSFDKTDDIDSIEYELDYDLTKLASYIIWDNNTGLVIDSNTGSPFAEDSSLSLPDITVIESLNVSNIPVQRIKYNGIYYLSITDTLLKDDNDVTICVYKKDEDSNPKAIFTACCFAALCILFTCSCIFLLHSQHKSRKNQSADNQDYSGRHTYKHMITISIAILAASFTIVSSVLFCIQNILQIDSDIVMAFNNLSLLNESYNKNLEIITTCADKAGSMFLDDIVESLNYEYSVDLDEWLEILSDTIDAEKINIYNQDGIIVNSSAPYKGYSLTKSETDPEYRFWQLLNGSSDQLVFYSKETGLSYLGSRRTDDVGIVEIVTSNDSLDPLLEKAEFAELFKVQDYPDTDRYYYKRSEPETLYVLESGNAIEKTITNDLPETEIGETITGICRINGNYYLYVDSGNNEWVTIFAYPVYEILKSFLIYFTIFAFCYSLVAIIMCRVFKKKEYCVVAFPQATADTEYEYNDAFNNVISILVILIITILVVRSRIFSDSMLLLEFYDKWETGFNLISMLFILLSLAICIGLILLIDSFNKLICKVLPPKGATISTLLSNILKVVIAVSFLIGSLEQLGVNAMAITASLGMTGLALSIGSKDVVSDLVAGLFIAFEGQLQLGDYVSINNFSGIIESLGIRTTKIKYFNKEMIINNTNMKNVTNLSRGLNAFIISVNLPLNTDIEYLCNIINDSGECFSTACNGKLIKNLSFYGVEKINDVSITCMFIGSAAIENTSYCQRSCTAELLKILRENGFIVENDLKKAIQNIVCKTEN